MILKVKICGITRFEDAKLAVQLGAWAVGFVFYKKSPRYIESKVAAEIIDKLKQDFPNSKIRFVGVFAYQSQDGDEKAFGDRVARIADETKINLLQFHGDESPRLCLRILENLKSCESIEMIKAVRAASEADIDLLEAYRAMAETFLIDSAVDGKLGGTGQTGDWALARKAKKNGRILLSGGLNASNVVDAVQQVAPFGVDVSSGVEIQPGKKDAEKLRAFFKVLRDRGML